MNMKTKKKKIILIKRYYWALVNERGYIISNNSLPILYLRFDEAENGKAEYEDLRKETYREKVTIHQVEIKIVK